MQLYWIFKKKCFKSLNTLPTHINEVPKVYRYTRNKLNYGCFISLGTLLYILSNFNNFFIV